MVKFIFFLLLFYLSIKVFSRYVLPFLVRLLIKQTHKNFVKKNYSSRGKTETSSDGESEKQRKNKMDGGEYIDYEEIE